MWSLARKLKKKDNLLIYYAGHGHLDEKEEKGYWLPIDASMERPSKWVSNSFISDQAKATEAKHVLLIVDSCFSGSLTKTRSADTKKITEDQMNDFILDVGSNDGTFLNFFSGSNLFGIDPSIRKLKENYKKRIKKLPFIFERGYKHIKKKKFKLISAIAMFYDLKDPVLFMKKVKKILKKDGIFHIEVAYLPEIIKTFAYDTFCQEHYEYYSLISLNYGK